MKYKLIVKKLLSVIGIDKLPFFKKIQDYRRIKAYEKYTKQQKEILNRYGQDILRSINSICNDNGYHIWLEYGTLLGAVRNNQIIPHDIDMDFGIYADEYNSTLEALLNEKGFKKMHSFTLKDNKTGETKLTEITYNYNGLHVDLFFSFRDQNKRVSYVYHDTNTKYKYKSSERSVKRLISAEATPYERIILEDISCLSPNNPSKYLSQVYGKNYLTPDPKWEATNGDNIIEYLSENDYIGYYNKIND